ncbi:MAG: 50S ribosomal protein L9 [bacterium]|nr:50S ribosomal protein L9 [bacterium]
MKVVLLEKVANLGMPGEVKEVSAGYARNYLLPRKLVAPATPEAMKRAEAARKKNEKVLKQDKERFHDLAAKLKGMKVELKEKANPEGRLFAGIDAKKIAQCISRKSGEQVPESMIHLDKPVKDAGVHAITVKAGDQQLEISLNVIASDGA